MKDNEKKDLLAGGQEESKAEKARKERKEKTDSVKKAPKEPKEKKEISPKKKKTTIITVVIVIALVIAIFFMNFFGVFARTKSVAKLSNGTKVSEAEYEYYYQMYYSNILQMTQQYDAYGEGAGKQMTGFDPLKTPGEQKFESPMAQNVKLDKKYGKKPTWADFFEQQALQTAITINDLAKNAEEKGMKLSDADIKERDKVVEQLRKTAADNDYSLGAYLRENYGNGMNEKLFKELYNKQLLAQEYTKVRQKEVSDKISNKAINDEFKKNSKEYTSVDLRYFVLHPSPEILQSGDKAKLKESNKELKAKANEFAEGLTNDNFTEKAVSYAPENEKEVLQSNESATAMADTSYNVLKDYVNKDAAEWAFNKDTKVGDTKIVTVDGKDGASSYYIFLMNKPEKRDDSHTLSIRQILFKTVDITAQGGKDAKPHTDKEAKALADKTVAEWKKAGATDKAFAKLATEKTEDTASAPTGGLYEGITKTSSYVPEFLDWCFEEGRKAGDVGVIKTDYGYHVMYMVGESKDAVWQSMIRKALTEKKMEDYTNKLVKGEGTKISEHLLKKTKKKMEKNAKKLIANIESSKQQAMAQQQAMGSEKQ